LGIKIPLIVGIALLVSVVLLFGLEEPIEVKEDVSQKTVRILTPTETILVPQVGTVDMKEIKSSSMVEKISEPSLSAQSFPFEAYAIGTEVELIDFLRYIDNDLGFQFAFDSNHNLFTTNGDEVTYLDRGALTKTTWTIPNLGFGAGIASTIDSAGNYYYGQTDSILTKLVPSTDTFIQVQFGSSQPYHAMEISSSGEVFFVKDASIGKVNFVTGEITTWPTVVVASDMALDSNENIYYVGRNFQGEFLVRLDPISNVISSWILDDQTSFTSQTLAIDNNDDIFINYFPGVKGKIQKVDPINNVLEEWVIPTGGSLGQRLIAVDSAGTVYFLDDLTRLVPSTGKFTQWSITSQLNGLNHITIDSNDDLWITGFKSGVGRFFGKITAP